jgi:pilus assembly protein CpaB
MKRRLIAALAAVLLAVTGGVLLLSYVSHADDRAMAGMQPISVLVAAEALPEGATSDQLAQGVVTRELPAAAVAPGAATNLAQLDGLVSTTALQPGEQLLTARFADPAVLAAARGLVVPKGLQQVSLQLDLPRVLGGHVAAGDTVGVFLSFKDKGVNYTQLALEKVLVTAVAGGDATGDAEGGGGAQPTGTMTVTLALDARGAQKVVFAAEHGSVWLSAEPTDAATGSLPVLTQKGLYS